MIAATAKDFTIMVRYNEIHEEENKEYSNKEVKNRVMIKNEEIYEYKGKKYLTRIGIIDLEGKLYTKIPTYIKEVESAYKNFVLYHNS